MSGQPGPKSSELSVVPESLTETGIVLAIAVVAALVSFVVRRVLRWLFYRSVRRAMSGRPTSNWNPRIERLLGETLDVARERRLQRADALAELCARFVVALVWFVALLSILDVLDVDVLVLVSGAGFLGAGLAFGGQHSVAAFFAGLHILWEDRFGVGDTLEWEVRDEPVLVIVERVGSFTTLLRAPDGALHVSNSMFSSVMNVSQSGSGTPTPD